MMPMHSRRFAGTRRFTEATRHRRRGVVAVKVAILSVLLIGFVALGVDVGLMYNARQELIRATDASVVAAAGTLAQAGTGAQAEELARRAGAECAERNLVAGDGLTLKPEEDIEFGQAEQPGPGLPFAFATDVTPFNAVRVTGRRTASAPDGPIRLYFGAIFGRLFTEYTWQSVAVMKPRDIAIVADTSNSHNNDSELRSYQDTDINLWEAWSSTFERGDWSSFGDTTDPRTFGWGWGFFKSGGRGYGSQAQRYLDGDTYDPNADPGLVSLPYAASPFGSEHWSPATADYAALQTYLVSKPIPYAGKFDDPSSEVGVLLHDTTVFPKRRTNWKNRLAVVTGYADWDSGKPESAVATDPKPWHVVARPGASVGNGDDIVDDFEVVWDGADRPAIGNRTPDEMKALWEDYTTYVSSTSRDTSTMLQGNPDFRFKVGIKTFFNFLLDRHPTNSEFPEFAESDAQPMLAVKDAMDSLSTTLSAERKDLVSLETFGTTAVHRVDLTDDVGSVAVTLRALQAGHDDGFTNIGGGLRLAIESLTGPLARPRSTARKVIVLLSDGEPTAFEAFDENGDITVTSGRSGVRLEQAKDYARAMAERANENGIILYAISVGAAANQDFLVELAGKTGGKHFHAEGEIEEYAAALKEIFSNIADIRPVELVQ